MAEMNSDRQTDKNVINTMPEAYARIRGGREFPEIKGDIYFFGVHDGTVVTAKISGLPDNGNGNFYGFHIHEGTSCADNQEEPFERTGEHYNPQNQNHPGHAGDLPVLMGNNGMAWCEVYTNRFYPEDVIGRTVVIHNMADDFKSQLSGNSGKKIACGEIKDIGL